MYLSLVTKQLKMTLNTLTKLFCLTTNAIQVTNIVLAVKYQRCKNRFSFTFRSENNAIRATIYIYIYISRYNNQPWLEKNYRLTCHCVHRFTQRFATLHARLHPSEDPNRHTFSVPRMTVFPRQPYTVSRIIILYTYLYSVDLNACKLHAFLDDDLYIFVLSYPQPTCHFLIVVERDEP